MKILVGNTVVCYMKCLGNTRKYKRDKSKVEKREKRINLRIVLIILLVGIICIEYRNRTPDLVSTINSMNYEYCSVIAYENSFVDKEQLANRLIEMCKENSFKSIKFATDVRGYPAGIYMRVYLNRLDFKRGKIFMQVKYLPMEKNWTGNIKDNREQYVLYIDPH